MARRTATLLLVWAVLAAACGSPAPPWERPPQSVVELHAALDRTEVPLLGELELRLDLFWRGDGTVQFDPAVPDGFQGEVSQGGPQAWGGGTWRRTVLRLRPVTGPGTVAIPPFTARLEGGGEASSPALELRVTSVLGEHGPAIEAPGAPFPPAFPWAWAAAVAGLLLVAAASLWWFVRARRRRPAPAEVPVPCHVKAQRELARLRGVPRRTPAEIDAFYVAVSGVLRLYLEERFGWRAPERTTEEFLQELGTSRVLDPVQQRELRGFLGQCDLVKFAAVIPGEPVHLQTLEFAEQFVATTRADGDGARGMSAAPPARALQEAAS